MIKNNPNTYIKHILENIKDIEEFSKELTKNKISEDKLRQKAIIRSIEIIGEAVKNLPESFRKNYPKIPWKKIAGTRDRIIHHYFGIDLDIVWEIIKKDLPALKKQILEIKRVP
ncbi:MAG: DUF86 domain-containing protein [Nanoarchaeota archaeon]|nr:DUF86 domain-containing protein [Nanoarchaeota archaeon]